MTKVEIATCRLINQQIAATAFTTPAEIVQWLGAVQAQDYNMAKWAVGLRLSSSTERQIEAVISNGDIIRTHILRPTWHFVASADLRWMLQLTAPHIKRAASYMYKQVELDDKVFAKTNKIIIRLLEGGKQLTRQELMEAINKEGIVTNALRASHITFHAELEGILCNGARRDKQHTYCLLEERIPSAQKVFNKAEALAELALRYFTSHGPASLQDFTWWSGLPVNDARQGLEQIKSSLISETIEGQIYWMSNVIPVEKPNANMIHLLPAFDEFLVSYKDRTASLPLIHNKAAITVNGIFKPVIVVSGKVVGLWKRSAQKQKMGLDVSLLDTSTSLNLKQLSSAVKKYATFLNTEILPMTNNSNDE